MPGPGIANVQSLDALRDLRLALIAFGERTDTALGEIRSKIDRTLSWLEQDCPLYWREQERRGYDLVASTRVAYETCRMRTVGGRHSECIEEKVAHQRAKVRLEFCKHKIEVVRRWNVVASQQADEYRGRSGPLQMSLEDELSNVVAMLSRMIGSLEAYADVHPDGDQRTSVSLGTIEKESKPQEPAETDDATAQNVSVEIPQQNP